MKLSTQKPLIKISWTILDSDGPNQVKMTQYLIFYCTIDQNGLKKSEVTKTAVL
jgi:hypothetical protein